MKNINNKKLKICSLNPKTGYMRDGYCRPIYSDLGKHLVCAKMNKEFLNYTAGRGNDLRSVVKEGENWCLCEDRYYQAYISGKSPQVIQEATHKNINNDVKKAILKTNKKSSKKPKSKSTKKRKSKSTKKRKSKSTKKRKSTKNNF